MCTFQTVEGHPDHLDGGVNDCSSLIDSDDDDIDYDLVGEDPAAIYSDDFSDPGDQLNWSNQSVHCSSDHIFSAFLLFIKN